jgi:hypothetical protein
MVQVLGFVKNEQCFSTLAFMNTKVCNQLNTHLDLRVKMLSIIFLILETTLFHEAIATGKKKSS